MSPKREELSLIQQAIAAREQREQEPDDQIRWVREQIGGDRRKIFLGLFIPLLLAFAALCIFAAILMRSGG